MMHLPVTDMLWLSKERLEYFVVISSWTGRLVKGAAVRKRTRDYILLSRLTDCLKATHTTAKMLYCILLMKNNVFRKLSFTRASMFHKHSEIHRATKCTKISHLYYFFFFTEKSLLLYIKELKKQSFSHPTICDFFIKYKWRHWGIR